LPVVEKDNASGPTVLRDTGGNQFPVELSNVDLGEETVQQILAHRSFEANLQTITTGNSLLGSVLDIKK
jgi:flagellar hook protein FlgE